MFCCGSDCAGTSAEGDFNKPVVGSHYDEEPIPTLQDPKVAPAVPKPIIEPVDGRLEHNADVIKAVPIVDPKMASQAEPKDVELFVAEPEPQPEPTPAVLCGTFGISAGSALDLELVQAQYAEGAAGTQGATIIRCATYQLDEVDGAHGPWGSGTSPQRELPRLATTISAGLGLLPGDAIVEVAGSRFSTGQEVEDAVREAHLQGGSVTIGYNPRPEAFTAELVRKEDQSEKIGLSVLLDKQVPSQLTVRVVRPVGMVLEYNTENPFRSVCAGDLVVGVNDARGKASEMLELLKSPEVGMKLRLHIRTPERK